MSSIDKTPIRFASEVNSEAPLPETLQNLPPADRRSANPYEQSCRKLFDKLWKIIRRYSKEIDAMTPEEVAIFLKEEFEEIKGLDALIPLKMLEKKGELNNENGDDIKVGVYRLTSPSIKDLNDKILGPNQTDELIDELNRSNTEKLAKNSGRTLNTTFKRGIFTMNFTELVNGSGRSPNEVLGERIQEIKDEENKILRKNLEARIAVLAEKRIALIKEQLHENRTETTSPNYELREQIRKIDETIEELENLCIDLIHGNTSVSIAFGFDQLPTDTSSAFMAMRNAECAANISALNEKETNVTMYSHHAFLTAFLKGYQEFKKESTHMVDGKREVKGEWRDFAYIDEKGTLRMHPKMITIYRGLDKYKLGREYRSMTTKQRMEFQEKIATFGRYYSAVNIADVLKNFVAPNSDAYLEKIDAIANLLNQCEQLIQTPTHLRTQDQLQEMKDLLSQTTKVLEVSLKDDGNEVIRTTRAAVKELMKEGDKVIIYTDNIGFGSINQASYEQSLLDLVELLQLTPEQWKDLDSETVKVDEVVTPGIVQKAASLPEFQETLLAIGDHGTHYLRANEKRLGTIFEGTGIINADGGDESIAIFQAEHNPDMPTNEEKLRKDLLKFSNDFRMRIAAVITSFTFNPIKMPVDFYAVGEEQRRDILQHIFGHKAWAEEEHARIKELNSRGYNRISSKVEHKSKYMQK